LAKEFMQISAVIPVKLKTRFNNIINEKVGISKGVFRVAMIKAMEHYIEGLENGTIEPFVFDHKKHEEDLQVVPDLLGEGEVLPDPPVSPSPPKKPIRIPGLTKMPNNIFSQQPLAINPPSTTTELFKLTPNQFTSQLQTNLGIPIPIGTGSEITSTDIPIPTPEPKTQSGGFVIDLEEEVKDKTPTPLAKESDKLPEPLPEVVPDTPKEIPVEPENIAPLYPIETKIVDIVIEKIAKDPFSVYDDMSYNELGKHAERLQGMVGFDNAYEPEYNYVCGLMQKMAEQSATH
jgi:hypothetical protein